MRSFKHLLKLNKRIELRNLFSTFFNNSSTGGILLLISVIAALVIANNPEWAHIMDILNIEFGFSLGRFHFEMSVLHWINDGLMTIFFLVVGLEIKREMLVGELSTFKQAALPIFAAIGGMVLPALLYVFFNENTISENGWGTPMATDIAFALGILSLLGKRVPVALKVFLTALAIVDDLGAIIVLAVFYPTHAINIELLIYSGILFTMLLAFNRLNIKKPAFYIVPGVILWFLILGSGIHATIAGVLLAITIPGRSNINEVRFIVGSRYLINKFAAASDHRLKVLSNHEQQQAIHSLHQKLDQVHPLMIKVEHMLHPWVTFFIMPVFALANAGVLLDPGLFKESLAPIVPGIFFGLLFGKPFGIFIASWIAVKLKIAVLPGDMTWSHVFSVGIIAGIGFTMSIFIDNLAFTDQNVINMGKMTIIGTSFIAAVIGLTAILLTTKNKQQTTNNNKEK
ncbi:MAG: Na+/H+ antiporter NhaA [Bacteroidales bacterium]|jgi:NhaA family Na+:H+ antiporter|nr:Na+/H+ antiporter NhaA [Bacteroidales bacterium]MDD3272532.1 Na+/H+ antiporter NhaA [Bacteroidales bacterium]MDD4057727.1 Na+/H+ antiporter NhaA [Bacteroidales bacterium]